MSAAPQLLARGECILHWLETTYERRESGPVEIPEPPFARLSSTQTVQRSRPDRSILYDPLGLTPFPSPTTFSRPG